MKAAAARGWQGLQKVNHVLGISQPQRDSDQTTSGQVIGK
jgi:hypothetical protein